ncbi:hypothetical protein BDV93DRAFT_225394 [Ceratobasidium sp. AG-I]|nr:hypothetical protein BDV93DRAFT_225394 [Ceratobasidium sp. AG-I]
MRVFVQKYWYYLLVFVRFGLDTIATSFALGNYVHIITYYVSTPDGSQDTKLSDWFTPISLRLAYWLTASVNSIFLLTYDFLYTNTILGSFLVQQFISVALVALLAGETVR